MKLKSRWRFFQDTSVNTIFLSDLKESSARKQLEKEFQRTNSYNNSYSWLPLRLCWWKKTSAESTSWTRDWAMLSALSSRSPNSSAHSTVGWWTAILSRDYSRTAYWQMARDKEWRSLNLPQMLLRSWKALRPNGFWMLSPRYGRCMRRTWQRVRNDEPSRDNTTTNYTIITQFTFGYYSCRIR